MNIILVFVLIAAASSAYAKEEIYQTRRYSNERDYTAPSYIKDGNVIYEKRLSGERDYTKPSYIITGDDRVYTMRPSGEPDYTKPARKIK